MSTPAGPLKPTWIEYPDTDGEPMAENTIQFQWLTLVKNGLEAVFKDDPNVFIAGDLFWYPVEGDVGTRVAPDVLVALDRPKGHRYSYLQWEEDGVPPQVVFEILSPGNRKGELEKKFEFYDRFGVEEYYTYDPERLKLAGWLRREGRLERIDDLNGWVSPRLGVRFELSDQLYLYGPDDRLFASYLQLYERAEVADERVEAERQRAEVEARRAELANRRAEAERQRADVEARRAQDADERAEAERQKAEAERQRAERLAARLRELGLEPEE